MRLPAGSRLARRSAPRRRVLRPIALLAVACLGAGVLLAGALAPAAAGIGALSDQVSDAAGPAP